MGAETKQGRAPLKVGDWVALGLAGGKCPVGVIEAMDDTLVTLALKNWLTGEASSHLQVVRWSDVAEIRVAYPEHARDTAMGLRVEDDHLGEFQTRWAREHEQQPGAPLQ